MTPSLSREPTSALELWGGHECTVNRVGDCWFDQTWRSGHEHRPDDLALFAGLGIRKLRYPALWERIAPYDPTQRDFRWTDERLPLIRELGMEPILTLCHHGSGPRYTSLIDPGFAAGLADHAAAVAARYSWVQDYTPVNEPLTTARFSALYGFWYPHRRDEGDFWLALLNQTDATRLAMREIRRVNPAARLIQTDDLGFCHASEPLRWEADFQNERRWMGWDLLCGRVVPGHALWDRLVDYGYEDRLRAIADDPCPPDVIGVNHYLSSERLLDHRIELYGRRAAADGALGDSAGITLVDVDAIRHVPGEVIGLSRLIEQAWQRYGIPVAITEAHHGSTREEQARWFLQTWRQMQALREDGVDVAAVTAWSLLGSFDWDHMVTRSVGHYEPGVFDLRHGLPRPTLMAPMLADLAAGREPTGASLHVPGWWHPDRRGAASGFHLTIDRDVPALSPYLMILGDAGVLTRLCRQACEVRGLFHVVHDAAGPALPHHHRPWAVIDARQHRFGLGEPAAALDRLRGGAAVPGVLFALDSDDTGQAPGPGLLVIDSGPIFTADDDAGAPVDIVDALDAANPIGREGRAVWKGVYGPSLVDAALDLLLDGVSGRVRFDAVGPWTHADLALALKAVVDQAASGIIDLPAPEPAAAGEVPRLLPPPRTVLERFVQDRRWMRAMRHPSTPSVEPVEQLEATA